MARDGGKCRQWLPGSGGKADDIILKAPIVTIAKGKSQHY